MSEKVVNKNKDMAQLLIEKNKEINELKKKYDEDIKSLTIEMNKLKKSKIILSTDDRSKEVLKLFAYGYGVGLIHKIMTSEMGLEITIDEIVMLTSKVEVLNSELFKYYLECKKDFKEMSTIDSGFMKSILYKKFSLLENEMTESLVKAKMLDDESLQLKIREQLSQLYDRMAKSFAKNMEDLSNDNSVEELMEDYNNKDLSSNENIIVFDLDNAGVAII